MKTKKMTGLSFYFVIGELETKNVKDFKNINDLHSYIINNTYQITIDLDKAQKIINDQTKFVQSMSSWDKFKSFFVPQPKFWKIFQVESKLQNYNSEQKIYINKMTLDITQIKPSNEKDFISYKLGNWCGTTLINGCEDSD
jgi:hypothetical protein